MKVAVRYYSKSGNTKKIAEAIAKAVGVEAKEIFEPLTEDVDLLFFGCAPYAFDVDPMVKKFIKDINVNIDWVVNFCTTAGIKSTRKYIEKLFSEKGIKLAEREFSCRGEFGIFHKGKPNSEDMKAAAEFAKQIVHE